MSLMIMAIGVVSVMTLFPIATLRTAQATKLTNSAIHKYNLESLLEVRPDLMFDPDGDGNLTEHFRQAAARNYIVDPLGAASIFEETASGPGAATFGHGAGGIPRFDGGISALYGTANARRLRMAAQELAGLGDGWDTPYEFFPVSATGITTSIEIPDDVIADVDLPLVPTSANTLPAAGFTDPEWTRIVLFGPDGTFSQSYPLLAIDGVGNATWSETTAGNVDFNQDGYVESRTLPREFEGVVSRVLIQTRKTVDYSWLLTVRRSADGRIRSMDVVVRFGSEPKFDSEQACPVIPATAADVTELLVDATVFGTDAPAIKKGSYIFDTNAARWHRVRDYDETNTANIYQVTLERPAGSFVGPAVIIPGVVEVYGMGSRPVPDNVLRGF